MKLRGLLCCAVVAVLLLTSSCSGTRPAESGSPMPRLEKRGAATQLIVDGQPFLALAGELTNTAASSPEHMRTVWPHLVKVGLNTVLAPVA